MNLSHPYHQVHGPALSCSQAEDLHRGYHVDLMGDLECGDVFISRFEGEEIIVQCICSTEEG